MNETENSVYIDDSSEVLKERLELCRLRAASYTPDEVRCGLRSFFEDAFRLLEEKSVPEEEAELCKQKETETDEIKAGGREQEEKLCKLKTFWLLELAGLTALKDGGSLKELVWAWETTLQLLFAAETSAAENAGAGDGGMELKEWKNILYSYVYDYAGELVCGKTNQPAPEHFVTGLWEALRRFAVPGTLSGTAETVEAEPSEAEVIKFSGCCSPQVQLGLELFFGDRLKARLLELIEKDQTAGGEVSRPHNGSRELSLSVGCGEAFSSAAPVLTPHQRKALRELIRKARTVMALLLCTLLLAACGTEELQETEETAAETTEAVYPGQVAYKAPESKETDHFGVMYATVLDVQAGEKDGLYIYTLRDREDPENAWCLNSQDIGSIFTETESGQQVALLYSGDMANDPDSVSFIALLDDASYTIRNTEGSCSQNMLDSFVVKTARGQEMTFIKDNCRVDRDALNTDGSTRILVYYADGGGELYPVRVYLLEAEEAGE